MSSELAAFLDEVRRLVDEELARILGEGDEGGEGEGGQGGDDPGRLREAMRYAVLGGGKRLRPALALGAARAVAGEAGARVALPAAAAVELLHAYTLVHDDLPSMDDDVERRGRPTVHVAFGEATAILAGDALLTLSFAALARLGAQAAEAVTILAGRTGARGLLAGQCRDLALSRGGAQPATLAELERIHADKTGALFAAAAELGALAAGATPEQRAAMAEFGMAFGIAFQHADDLADGDQPAFATAARRRLVELTDSARTALAPFGPAASPLEALLGTVRSF